VNALLFKVNARRVEERRTRQERRVKIKTVAAFLITAAEPREWTFTSGEESPSSEEKKEGRESLASATAKREGVKLTSSDYGGNLIFLPRGRGGKNPAFSSPISRRGGKDVFALSRMAFLE